MDSSLSSVKWKNCMRSLSITKVFYPNFHREDKTSRQQSHEWLLLFSVTLPQKTHKRQREELFMLFVKRLTLHSWFFNGVNILVYLPCQELLFFPVEHESLASTPERLNANTNVKDIVYVSVARLSENWWIEMALKLFCKLTNYDTCYFWGYWVSCFSG